MQHISDEIKTEVRSDEHTEPRHTTLFQWSILFGMAGLLLVCDQITKALVVDRMYLYETWVPVKALKNVFDITYTQNTGAAFGLLPSASGLFLLVAIIASFVIVYYYRQIRGSAWLLRVVMGLQLGGALGNAIDRVTRGFVVDFLHVFYKPVGFDFPIFNLADSAIVIGVGLLVIILSLEPETKPTDSTSPSNSTDD